MEPPLETFDDARDRSGGELRELLGAPAPRQRVWAAWELGLRLESDVVPLLEDRLPEESHPGVRRHLVRILAGFEAFDLLRDLADSAPDPAVRRDARRFLRRCAPEGR